MTENQTDFLGFPCEVIGSVSTMLSSINVEAPYKYHCILDYGAAQRVKDLGGQAKLNLVKKSIEINQNGKQVIWHCYQDDNELELRMSSIYKVHSELKEKLIPLKIDDYALMRINHANKPYKILELLAERLETHESTSRYTLKAEDFISCDILVDPINFSEMLYSTLKSRGNWFSIEGVKILQHLKENKLINMHFETKRVLPNNGTFILDVEDSEANAFTVSMTMDGWASLNSLSKATSNNAFIAMAFSAWGNEAEEKEKLILAIKKACSKLGYEADIVSQGHTENISNRIFSEIKSCRFMVCDFTHQNQGAYYEAGYARALGKEVFHLVREDHFDCLQFDIRQINCQTWQRPEDVEQILIDWIEANEHL